MMHRVTRESAHARELRHTDTPCFKLTTTSRPRPRPPSHQGIEKVITGKQADQLGVKVGFKIVAISRVPVETAAEFTAEMSKVKAKYEGQETAPVEVAFSVYHDE